MKHDLVRALRLLVLPTLVVIGIVAFAPGRAGLAVRIYALVLCAVVLGLALTALRRAYPAATPLRPTTKRSKSRRSLPPSLARIEDEMALGVASTFDLQRQLIPRLRRTTAGLLMSRRGISLDTDHDAARRVVGDETWELIWRRRALPSEDRLARGIPTADLRRVVESLEQI